MSGFIEKLKLKERAEEDMYFAKRDRELIEALHRNEHKTSVQDQRQPVKPGFHPDGDRSDQRNRFIVALCGLIQKLCPKCRDCIRV